jgi:hypothetical protein
LAVRSNSIAPARFPSSQRIATSVALPRGGFDQRANERIQTESLGLAIIHEQAKRFGSVKRSIFTGGLQFANAGTSGNKVLFQGGIAVAKDNR